MKSFPKSVLTIEEGTNQFKWETVILTRVAMGQAQDPARRNPWSLGVALDLRLEPFTFQPKTGDIWPRRVLPPNYV